MTETEHGWPRRIHKVCFKVADACHLTLPQKKNNTCGPEVTGGVSAKTRAGLRTELEPQGALREAESFLSEGEFGFWLCVNPQGKSREWAGVRLSRKKRFQHMRILRHSHVYPPNYTDGQQAGRERERETEICVKYTYVHCMFLCMSIYIYTHIL